MGLIPRDLSYKTPQNPTEPKKLRSEILQNSTRNLAPRRSLDRTAVKCYDSFKILHSPTKGNTFNKGKQKNNRKRTMREYVNETTRRAPIQKIQFTKDPIDKRSYPLYTLKFNYLYITNYSMGKCL